MHTYEGGCTRMRRMATRPVERAAAPFSLLLGQHGCAVAGALKGPDLWLQVKG
jgi:hypothetical protein